MTSDAEPVSDSELEELERRLHAVRARIDTARARSGRAVRLIAVSKGQPARLVRALYGLGQRDFGENYVQELTQKGEALRDLPELRWHVIGHLQRNKVKHVVAHASALHSVDSLALIAELGQRMGGREVPVGRRVFTEDGRLPVLIEVSIAGEAQKSGCPPAALGELLDAAERTAALRLVGLMCVPPLSDDADDARPHFDALRELARAHGGPARLPELSMGMTADFEAAIAAGATVVRVGTALFGARAAPPPKVG
jgi:pyridoxal phosphate enzyme (YggS family)